MSLVSFKARNHPQQTSKRGDSESVDERYTMLSTFEPLHTKFKFTVDVAGHPDAPVSQLIGRYYTKADDGLSKSWEGERVWCNPPYSNIRPWLEKAYEADFFCALLPANRTEQGWWQELVEPYRDTDNKMGLRTKFLRSRINFMTPNNPTGKFKSSCPFGSVLVLLGV